MRRDVRELRAFYASPLGQAARDRVGAKIVEAWEGARRLDVLGIGYATPFLEAFRPEARRVIAVSPAAQGVEPWPAGRKGLACLSSETRLPFTNALFDRVLLVHALEESDDPEGMLAEAMRVLASNGRIILVAANRRGLWSRAESTPFGHGRPFTRSQLEAVVRAVGLEPTAWSRALYAPPHSFFAPFAEALEQVGSRLAAPMSGVILLEAVKQTLAVKPRGVRAPAFAPVFQPVPVGATRSAARVSRNGTWNRKADQS